MAEKQDLELSALAEFVKRHDIGIDDLFFMLHLGAKQLRHRPDMPPALREHWDKVSNECYTLWHNTLRDGTPVE